MISMKLDIKTQKQTNAYFLMQEQIAYEMNCQSIPLALLVSHIQPKPTKTSLHEVFKAILLSMYGKDSTKGMTREEMNNCLNVYFDALAMIGVEINFPSQDRENLLQFYSN